MASTFSNLGLNLQATGENSGTWGDLTNVNLQNIDNAIAGVVTITLTGNTTLAFTTNSSSTTFTDQAGRNKTIILSGSLSATTVTVTVPNIEKDYVIINNSGGTATISSGGSTTVSILTGSKNYVIVDPATTSVISAVPAANPGGATTNVQFNSSGSFAGNTNFTYDGTTVTALGIIATGATVTNAVFSSTANLLTQSELRFQDTTGGQYVGLRASTTVATSYTLNLPTTSGTANQVLVTDGSNNLSFATVSGGAAWQAIKTANFNATAKEGYFLNTNSTTITATLPASPTLGDFISFVDYAGTFDTNNFTVARNGNPIQGSATDLTVATERAGFTLVYVDATQGWLLQNN
jgi:hypothetical protein